MTAVFWLVFTIVSFVGSWIMYQIPILKKIYFIIYEKTNEHNKAEARVLFFLCIWAVVGLFFTVTIHVDRA